MLIQVYNFNVFVNIYAKRGEKKLLKYLLFIYNSRISDVLSPLKLTIQDVYAEYKEIIATLRYM